MRTLALFLILCFGSLAFADDFKTISGKEYKNAKVSRVEPDGIVIKFSGGIVKLPFIDLSPEIQRKYGYDSAAAAKYATEENQKQAMLAEQRKADLARAQELEQAARQPARSTTPSEHRHEEDSGLIYGTVIQALDDGLLVSVRANLFGPERIPEGAVVLLLGKFPDFYDGDKIEALGSPVGPFEYVTAMGLKKRARAFKKAAVKKLDEFPSDLDTRYDEAFKVRIFCGLGMVERLISLRFYALTLLNPS
jgi:hypothetical protein